MATVGRRKRAIARVRLFAKGTGKVTVNDAELSKFFIASHYQYIVLQPLKLLGLESSVDVRVKVVGGGSMGQAEAIRHGLSRALLKLDENYRKQLRPAGFLTRDARVKERKKPGLKRARRAPQFSKR
ncbi:MAG: 30S ribosomal protein S9 [Candidatus Veblenbacteria bacterium]|nr:30S ribosomal protein S9 [Candidatus Veblenbacteria bacterium]